MKKKLAIIIIFVLLFVYVESIASTMNIDLSTMTVEEMDSIIAQINEAKRTATEVTSATKRHLEADFMKAIEEINPKGSTFNYPFFGLSIVHRQDYFCVCGTVGCNYPDGTHKDLWDATMIYWYNAENETYKRAAFYSKDEVFSVDETALSHVVRHAEKVCLDNLARHNIHVKEYQPAVEGQALIADNTDEFIADFVEDEATQRGGFSFSGTTKGNENTSAPNKTVAPKTSPSPTVKKTATPKPTVKKTATPKPTVKKTATPKPTAKKTATPKPTVKKTATPKPTVKKTATPKPTVKKTATPKPTVKKTATPKPTVRKTATPKKTATPRRNEQSYVLNTNSGVFHKPTCSSVRQMKEKNKRYYSGTRDEVLDMGYRPCQKCHP